MRLVANKRSNQPSLRPCRAREDHLHEGVLQGQITRVTPAAIKLRMQRFSKGNFIGTSVQRCRTVLSCTKRATFLFPEPHSAVGLEFHLRRTGDRDSDDVATEGQRFSGGDIGGTSLRLFTVSDRVRNGVLSCFPSHLRLLGQNFSRDIHGTGPTPS